MNKGFFIFLQLVICFIPSIKGQEISLSGSLIETGSGEKIIYALIHDSVSGKSTLSNTQAFFSLKVKPGFHCLSIRCVGYNPLAVCGIFNSDTLMKIELDKQLHSIQEVVVEGRSTLSFGRGLSAINLPVKSLDKMPVLIGEKDIMKGMQLLPGVDGGVEGNVGIFVRGGNNDQNLILLDGVPVFHSSHFQGFFSTFNSDALRNVYLYKDIPSRFGDRLSSIIDIYTREGNMNKWTGSFTLGVLTSKFTIEGPLKKDKTSILLAARRTYLDLLYKDAFYGLFNNNWTDYNFYDINAKIKHRFSERLTVSANLFNGSDYAENQLMEYYGNNSSYGLKEIHQWKNLQASTSSDWLVSPSTSSKLTMYYSEFSFSNNSGLKSDFYNSSGTNISEDYSALFLSNIQVSGLNARFESVVSGKSKLLYGLESEHSLYKPLADFARKVDDNGEAVSDSAIFDTTYKLIRLTAYIENQHKLTPTIDLNYGIRLSVPFTGNKNWLCAGPYISSNYELTTKLKLNAGFARNYQYTHQLGMSSLEQTTDLWVPVAKGIPPAYSNAFSAGTTYSFYKNISLGGSAFYKDYHNLIMYRDGASYMLSGENWTEQVNLGKGKSYGLELLLEKTEGKISGWISYTLLKSTRVFPESNQGKEMPFNYDRRHSIKTCFIYQLNKKINITAVWVYSSGHPVTVPVQKYNLGYDLVYARNAYRLEAYHRLDLAVNYTMFHKHSMRSVLSVGAYNVYNRQNPYKVDVVRVPLVNRMSVVYDLKESSLLPVLPYFSYTFSF